MVEAFLAGAVRPADGLLVSLPTGDQMPELLDQQIDIQPIDVLAETVQPDLGHQRVVLRGIADRHRRLAELQGTDDVVIARGDHDVGLVELTHQVVQRRDRIEGQTVSSVARLANTAPTVVFNLLQQLEALGLNVPSLLDQLGLPRANGSQPPAVVESSIEKQA